MNRQASGFAAALLLAACSPAAGSRAGVPVARPNDNRTPAVRLTGDSLTARLVAQPAEWRPAADSGPGLEIAALGVEGQPPTIPGPLLRVPLGTRVRLELRNALDDTIALCAPYANTCRAAGAQRVVPGATASLAFTADRPGVFLYRAALVRGDSLLPRVRGHQLVGTLAVDSADVIGARDRIFVMTSWAESGNEDDDTPFVQGINGRTWPHTERFDLTVGDSIRWHWLNAIDVGHPMHLHGFYFRVDARGDAERDTIYTSAQRELVVTDDIPGGGTASFSWAPTRPGHWLLHCHKASHMSPEQHAFLARRPVPDSMAPHSTADHPMVGMGGLILGISVRGSVAPGDPAAAAPPGAETRRLRLLLQERPAFYGSESALGFVLSPPGADVAADSVEVPGPTLELTRGVPVAITVVNRLRTQTSVHWHGIELQSYYDGVAGWSGTPDALAPMIAPGDSFVAVFAPPRSGTFMYHAHVGEGVQLTAGLYAPIVVLEPGERRDPSRDHVVLFSALGRSDSAMVGANGRYPPDTLVLRAGRPNRLRLINITAEDDVAGALVDGGGTATWREVAKDGAARPPAQAAPRRAEFSFGPGEIIDVELTPARGAVRLRIASFNNFDIPVVAR